MKTSTLRSQFYFPGHPNLTTHSANPQFFVLTRTTQSHLKHPSNLYTPFTFSRTPATMSRQNLLYPTKAIHKYNKPIALKLIPKSQNPSKMEFPLVSSNGYSTFFSKMEFPLVNLRNGYSRFVVVGAVSLGVVLILMGMDEQKALALGPEGPLMEEFWDNVRRYGLYALTVSTGALYTLFQPIFELLKNPISAILILTIIGGSFFIVSQIVSAMIGISEFPYEYGY